MRPLPALIFKFPQRILRIPILGIALSTCLFTAPQVWAKQSLVPAKVFTHAGKPDKITLEWHTDSIHPLVRQRIANLLSQTTSLSEVHLIVGPETNAGPEQIQVKAWEDKQETWIQVSGAGRGMMFGLYAALEKLGFRFWHPLKPFIPQIITRPSPFKLNESPVYNTRGFTHHTMHPLELAHVLNGWGPNGPDDLTGWHALLPEWESYLEWLIANRQNEVEWVLLEKAAWAKFARSSERQQRLQELVEIGHAWKIRVGIDAPLALEQQNGWRLIPQTGEPEQENVQLRNNLDWLTQTGVDFLSTELGTSEFTHGGAGGILSWLNSATAHLAQKRIPFYSKIHISTGQFTQEFKDPQTGGPLNINYIPYYADPRLGVMPHTVQIYGLDDPAPTYGHQDFSDMHRFMRFTSGKHPMLWFPESAYWVNYDIHVPLFLPVYARQRVHDLRLLHHERLNLEGQMMFSSGWENMYWLNDLLCARIAWDPLDQAATDEQALQSLLKQSFEPYGPAREELVALILDTMNLQHRLLILGQYAGTAPIDPVRRNGIAYLAGQDTWSQLAGVIRSLGLNGYQTQPERLEFETLRKDPGAARTYREQIAPLLQTMQLEFKGLSRRSHEISHLVPVGLTEWYREIENGLELNSLRVELVYQLMEATLDQSLGQMGSAKARLQEGLQIIQQAESLTQQQVAHYRANPDRIAGWGQPNPTAYNYGYLWPARTLYFWKRDWLQVATQNYHPCFMNIIDPLEIALPNPEADPRANLARGLIPGLGFQDCFQVHPPDLQLQNLAVYLKTSAG